ncbi:hypothetical protein LXL04_017449 [Taraxacum kok-saghyz]
MTGCLRLPVTQPVNHEIKSKLLETSNEIAFRIQRTTLVQLSSLTLKLPSPQQESMCNAEVSGAQDSRNFRCPPAPKKQRHASPSCNRRLSEFEFFEVVARDEIDSFFRSNYELINRNSSKKRRCPTLVWCENDGEESHRKKNATGEESHRKKKAHLRTSVVKTQSMWKFDGGWSNAPRCQRTRGGGRSMIRQMPEGGQRDGKRIRRESRRADNG